MTISIEVGRWNIMFTQYELTFGYDALEPVLDALTVEKNYLNALKKLYL